MKKLLHNHSFYYLIVLLLSAGFLFSCKYDVRDLGAKPTASFTATPIAGQTSKYLLTSTSQNGCRYDWDKANGSGYVTGKDIDT